MMLKYNRMGQAQSIKHDTALAFIFFNPSKSKRILMNYLYTINRLRQYPCYTIELTFDERMPEISGPNVFHVKSHSYMFHKERLCRILETKIPKKFKKIVFLDADILFSDPNWYSQMSKKLDSYEVVQGFEFCHWLDLTYKNVMLSRETSVKSPGSVYSHTYHPGFVWGFQRDWYKKVGFFDWAVSGSGDTLSVAAWMKQSFSKETRSLPSSMKDVYTDFCTLKKPKISYLEDIHVFHLYHGSRVNRQYVDRHAILNIQKDIRSLLTMNTDGVYEWVEPTKWNVKLLTYFVSRDDDSIEVVVPNPEQKVKVTS
jgi:hypothetical protein